MARVSTPNRQAPRRAPLTREGIARAALALIDREGLDAASMRRLAAELQVGTMTLYGYFRDKDELLDAVIEAAAEEHPIEVPEGPWRERLRRVAHDMRQGLAAHPSLVQLRLRRPIMTPGAMRAPEAGLHALREAGLGDADAATAFRVIFLYAFGFAGFSAPEVTDELRAYGRAALTALPPEDYPTVWSMLPELTETLGGERQFELGLELILDGIEARAARRS